MRIERPFVLHARLSLSVLYRGGDYVLTRSLLCGSTRGTTKRLERRKTGRASLECCTVRYLTLCAEAVVPCSSLTNNYDSL
jgi:hypothetical protein